MTANPKMRRFRSRVHLAHVASHACCVPGCGGWPVEIHHLLMGPEPKGRGIKASDFWSVPLCRAHHTGHDSPHHHGHEEEWAERHGFGLMSIARRLQWSSPVRLKIVEHMRDNPTG